MLGFMKKHIIWGKQIVINIIFKRCDIYIIHSFLENNQFNWKDGIYD